MLIWLLLGIGVYLIGIFFAASFLVARVGLMQALGPRDGVTVQGVYAERARRAAENAKETFPIFLALGVLSFVVEGTDQVLALQGAQIYVIARLIYIPAYVIALPFLRSLVFAVSMAGLVLMGAALI